MPYTRSCSAPVPANGGLDCDRTGDQETREQGACNEQPCPVDGGWSAWGPWDACSASCGPGNLTRARQCDSPLPDHGGLSCAGDEVESQSCNLEKCVVEGELRCKRV